VEADLDPAVMREYEQVRSSGEQRTTDGQALCQLPLGVAHAWLPAASCRASALIGGLHSLPYTEYTLLPLLSFPSPQAGIRLASMWDVYCHTWLPFGGLLTDMEAVGMAVDRAHLAAAQQQAEGDQRQAQERFRCGGGGGGGGGLCGYDRGLAGVLQLLPQYARVIVVVRSAPATHLPA